MRPILSSTRSLLADIKLDRQDWATVIPTIASALKEARIDRLGYHPNSISRYPL